MLPIFWRCGFDSTAGIPPFPKRYAIQCAHSTTMYSILAVAIFWLFRLYQSVWRYASVDEVLRSVGGSMLTSALYMLARTFYFYKMPRSFHVFGAIIQLVLVVGARFSYRLLISVLWRISGEGEEAGADHDHRRGLRGSDAYSGSGTGQGDQRQSRVPDRR